MQELPRQVAIAPRVIWEALKLDFRVALAECQVAHLLINLNNHLIHP